MFKSMTVKANHMGKGIRNSTIPIDDIDLKKLTVYFNNVNHMQNPDPHKLQQFCIYNVLWYTCHHGMENLETMKKDHYKIFVNPDGMRYIQQNIDELDKNHREDTLAMANEGKIYENPGKFNLNTTRLIVITIKHAKFVCENITKKFLKFLSFQMHANAQLICFNYIWIN